jgi:hypothetical protein
MKLTRRQVGLTAALLAALMLVLSMAVPGVPDPVHQGKRVSVWFDQLCTGVFTGPRRKDVGEAYEAFHHMGPEAVPYLVGRLDMDPSGRIEKTLLWLRRYPITEWMVKGVILPSSKRHYAQTALGAMGGSAVKAMPALLKNWTRESPSERANCTATIASIMYALDPSPDLQPKQVRMQAEAQQFERLVIAEAARRYPDAAKALRIGNGAPLKVAEPNRSAGGSQPPCAQQGATSAAGSGP